MAATNYILFSSICEKCSSVEEHRAQCTTCADYGGYDHRDDRLCNREYHVGDVMDWYPNEAARDTWPRELSFVSEVMKQVGAVYAIEGCYGECSTCRSEARFYFLFNNRQIMRLIARESLDLTLNSIVKR